MAKLDIKAKEELKNHLKELNIKNGKWEAPDGDIYYVCHQGKFYIHTIQITRVQMYMTLKIDRGIIMVLIGIG